MANNLIQEINKFSTFMFDVQNNKIINLKSQEETNIDEFLSIQNILDNNRIKHKFENNFQIMIID